MTSNLALLLWIGCGSPPSYLGDWRLIGAEDRFGSGVWGPEPARVFVGTLDCDGLRMDVHTLEATLSVGETVAYVVHDEIWSSWRYPTGSPCEPKDEFATVDSSYAGTEPKLRRDGFTVELVEATTAERETWDCVLGIAVFEDSETDVLAEPYFPPDEEPSLACIPASGIAAGRTLSFGRPAE